MPVKHKPDAAPRAVTAGWTPEYLRLWRGLICTALLLIGLCFVLSPIPFNDWRGVVILTLLTTIVSLIPVRLPGNNILTSPGLPIVFAAAGLFGAAAAMTVAGVSAATVILLTLPRKNTYRFRKFAQALAISTVEEGFPVLLYVFLHVSYFPHGGLRHNETPTAVAWGALSFCTLLSFVGGNILNTFLASRYYGRRWDLIWHENARWNMISGVMMSPIAFVAGVLYREHWWLGVAFIIIPTVALHMGVVYHERTIGAYKLGVELLGRMMQESHPYTHGHLNRVSHWAKKIAEELKLSPESMQFIEDAAILHDIGKVAVDDRVLNKVGKLSDDDWAMIRRHPEVGAEIVGRIRYFNKVSHWIRHHHERPDGAGYPDKMGVDDIPIEACIISAVDAYDAMVGGPAKEDKRPYREPMMPEAAIVELRKHAGTQFHSRVVETFVSILEREQALEASGEHPLAQLGPEGDSLWDAPLTTPASFGVFVTAGGR